MIKLPSLPVEQPDSDIGQRDMLPEEDRAEKSGRSSEVVPIHI